MDKTAQFTEIGLVIYPNALMSAVYGITDLFHVANQIAQKHAVQRPLLRITHWQASVQKKGAMECVFDTQPQLQHHPVILVAPPSFTEPISIELARPYAQWMKKHHDEGAMLASVCAGSFVLGATGLLAGRAATTHWSYVEAMTRQYPEAKIDGSKLIIDDGDIMTAGGFMAWVDLGLRIVHRLLGPTIMLETSRFLLVDPAGREQSFYSSFSPHLHHGDVQILKVQHWLQANGAKNVMLPDMARQAGLEERTFLRRFRKATGLKPTEYCQNLRVGKAREMLEFTNQNIDQIAWAVGYEDSGAFRKIFQKVMGLSPGEYRSRFGLTKVAAKTA